jgi:hypothetical protein
MRVGSIFGSTKAGPRIWNEEFKRLSTANLIETSQLSLAGKLWVCYFALLLPNICADLIAEDSIDRFGHDHEFTKLVIDLKGKDPDDAFSSIPYEKVCFLGKLIATFCS